MMEMPPRDIKCWNLKRNYSSFIPDEIDCRDFAVCGFSILLTANIKLEHNITLYVCGIIGLTIHILQSEIKI